jgi:SecD/SecF fusion protein
VRIIHFMRYKWWFLLSLSAVTIFAIIFVFVVRLDLGIDFRGGVRMQVGVEKQATVDEIRSMISDLGVQDPIVQTATGASGENSFMITADMTEEQQQQILNALDERFVVKPDSKSVERVGASFGKETTNRAFIAIAIAVIAIIGYLTFRFEFKFAVPAIVALVHDVGLTLGIYAAGNRLVTTATVAAILTILGYSVHDTIVVFDRMRENTGLMKKETYADMADLSIAQTMVRSINTSICVLLPLLAILIFGGPTLKDFAFALTIGVITGTYSSFFVATPLAVLWKEREPRYRKRLAAAGVGGVEVPLETAVTAVESKPAANRAPAAKSGAGKAVQPRSGQKSKKGSTSGKRPAGKAPKRTSR